MHTLVRSAAVALLTVLAGAACGTSLHIEVTEPQGSATPLVPTPEATATPSPDPEQTPTPTTPTPTAPATAEPTATAEPSATAEPTPTPEPTEVPIEFVVAPDAPLLGVPLGTDTETAMAQLVSLIGDPDADSGWYEGCPLDGDDLNERLVQWGDLNVYFDRFDGTEQLRAWGYDVRIVEGGFPEVELIQLPGDSRIGDPIDAVAAAAGLTVVYDEVFDINRVGEPGYEIVADAPADAPVWGAFVPAIPACE